jgi:transcriptional regulator with XRE-family HTH domain
MRWRIGAKLRALRKRRGWRQQDLANRIGCSRQLVSRIENDRLESVPFGKIQACVDELGGFLRIDLQWQGERLARLIDARHAAVQNRFVEMLAERGWAARVEVSFNHFGDRGRIDILAWHAATATVGVVEIKSRMDNAEETLGRIDVKARLAPGIAADLGWQAAHVVPILVLAEGTTQRRHLAEHAALFGRFDARGRAGLAWLRRPEAVRPPAGVLLFVVSPDSHAKDARRRDRS